MPEPDSERFPDSSLFRAAAGVWRDWRAAKAQKLPRVQPLEELRHETAASMVRTWRNPVITTTPVTNERRVRRAAYAGIPVLRQITDLVDKMPAAQRRWPVNQLIDEFLNQVHNERYLAGGDAAFGQIISHFGNTVVRAHLLKSAASAPDTSLFSQPPSHFWPEVPVQQDILLQWHDLAQFDPALVRIMNRLTQAIVPASQKPEPGKLMRSMYRAANAILPGPKLSAHGTQWKESLMQQPGGTAGRANCRPGIRARLGHRKR
jgi:hypothetical protein